MKESATRIDAYGAEYSADRLTLLKGPQISSLPEYRIEKGTRVIGYKAFSELSFLQTIDIPDSVTIIEDSAFSACHCRPEKFYHKVGCSTEPASGTLTGVVG